MTHEDRTELSHRAQSLAEVFDAAVRRVFSGCSVALTEPEASTGAGERAHQHIRLVTPDGKIFILGWVNVAERRAELRTLGYSLSLSKRRFGRELCLPPKEYMRFLEIATKVLEDVGLKVTVMAHGMDARGDEIPASPSGVRSVTFPYYAITAGSCAILAAVGWMVLR